MHCSYSFSNFRSFGPTPKAFRGLGEEKSSKNRRTEFLAAVFRVVTLPCQFEPNKLSEKMVMLTFKRIWVFHYIRKLNSKWNNKLNCSSIFYRIWHFWWHRLATNDGWKRMWNRKAFFHLSQPNRRRCKSLMIKIPNFRFVIRFLEWGMNSRQN